MPLLAWGPGLRARREATPVSLCDVAPTVLQALGVASPGPTDGVSLVSEATLLGPERKALLAWPLELHVSPESGQQLLYDLQADPQERHDLAVLRPQDTLRLARQLEAILRSAELDAARRGASAPGQQSLDEELKSLGDVQ